MSVTVGEATAEMILMWIPPLIATSPIPAIRVKVGVGVGADGRVAVVVGVGVAGTVSAVVTADDVPEADTEPETGVADVQPVSARMTVSRARAL
ncbi:hypothetical protein M1D88_05085 [Arthrobacter sp. R1-13]